MKGLFEEINKLKAEWDGLDEVKNRIPNSLYRKLKADIAKDVFNCFSSHKYKENIYKDEYINTYNNG